MLYVKVLNKRCNAGGRTFCDAIKLHPLKGNRDGIWSITVNGNWRITFEFINGNAFILNYEDYH